MNKLNVGGKVGLTMEAISGITMAILVLTGNVIPDLVAWIFILGLIIVIFSSLFSIKK